MDDYNGWYYEGMLLRAHENSPLQPREHAAQHAERGPRIKYFDELPHRLNKVAVEATKRAFALSDSSHPTIIGKIDLN
jgi:hypothetical protein